MEIEEENDGRIIEEKMEQEETTVDKSAPDVIDEDETLLKSLGRRTRRTRRKLRRT